MPVKAGPTRSITPCCAGRLEFEGPLAITFDTVTTIYKKRSDSLATQLSAKRLITGFADNRRAF